MAPISRDLSYLVEVKGDKVFLTARQLCARELESQYEAKFGREMPLEPLGFDSVSEMLIAMNDTLSVRGRGIRYEMRTLMNSL